LKKTQGKVRSIKKLNINTPILIPSFSSKGFPEIDQIYDSLKEKLTDASLISAYDLHYGYFEQSKIYESDVVFIDSGGYERNKNHDISDIYGVEHIGREWCEQQHVKQTQSLEPATDIVIVNYDSEKAISLEEQIEKATIFFEEFPSFATNFLCKPVRVDEILIDVDLVTQRIDKFTTFDILGFTEKELGESILERATNIYRIRSAMIHAGLDIPIHIFGCIDPLSITLYFHCGADIFDGLSWLRFSFKNGTPKYLNHYALSEGYWDKKDNEIKLLAFSENLAELRRIKEWLSEPSQLFNQSDPEFSNFCSEGIIALIEKINVEN
jgi:hypothetical protein